MNVSGGGSVPQRAQWTEKQEIVLIKIIIQFRSEGFVEEGGNLRKKLWKQTQLRFVKHTHFNYSAMSLKNKWQRLKEDYASYKIYCDQNNVILDSDNHSLSNKCNSNTVGIRSAEIKNHGLSSNSSSPSSLLRRPLNIEQWKDRVFQHYDLMKVAIGDSPISAGLLEEITSSMGNLLNFSVGSSSEADVSQEDIHDSEHIVSTKASPSYSPNHPRNKIVEGKKVLIEDHPPSSSSSSSSSSSFAAASNIHNNAKVFKHGSSSSTKNLQPGQGSEQPTRTLLDIQEILGRDYEREVVKEAVHRIESMSLGDFEKIEALELVKEPIRARLFVSLSDKLAYLFLGHGDIYEKMYVKSLPTKFKDNRVIEGLKQNVSTVAAAAAAAVSTKLSSPPLAIATSPAASPSIGGGSFQKQDVWTSKRSPLQFNSYSNLQHPAKRFRKT